MSALTKVFIVLVSIFSIALSAVATLQSIQSENWNAVSDQPLKKQQRVKVTGIDGLVLEVQPLSGSAQEEQS